MLVMTLIICGAVLFVATSALFTFQVLNFLSNFKRDTATLAAVIANNSTAALAFNDAQAGAEVVGSLQAKPTVVAASLVSPDGSLFAHFGKHADVKELSQFPPAGRFRFSGGYVLYTQPVELDRKRVGTLYLRANYRQTFLELLGFYSMVILGVMIVSFSLAVFLSGRLRRIITDPILALAETAQIVGEKQDYSVRATVYPRADELGRLTEAFNQMLSRIETQDHALKESRDAELKLSREKLRSLIDSIDGIVWERMPDMSQFTFVSRQAERILGYTPEEWLAQPMFWHEKLHPDDAAKAIATCQAMVARRQLYNHEYRMLAADGRSVWIHESGIVLNENDRPVAVRGILQDITEQKFAAAELDKLNRQLVETSRQAGMAEVATGVLHNVGNVLNSVNVSTDLIRQNLRHSEMASLVKLAKLLQDHQADLAPFLTSDPKGKLVPDFIILLAHHLHEEHRKLQNEHDQLARNIEHIKEIVAMQQNYARVSGFLEEVSIASLVEDALQIQTTGLQRHGVQVVRQYSNVPPLILDKHKALQILVNLVHNAKYALSESGRPDKLLTVGIGTNEGNRLKVTVNDNGIGIPPENLIRIFSHGFSTRKGGHGFGLHSGANAAKEMGGQLSVHSEGIGKGATFTLELPLASHKNGTKD
jgi:PAS domain S-box-containing protein